MSRPSSANGDERFRVRVAIAVAEQLRRLQRRAQARGDGAEFLNAYQAIMTELAQDADTAGEPLFRLPFLRMQLRTRCIRPLAVVYGITEESNYVFISRFRLLDRPRRR